MSTQTPEPELPTQLLEALTPDDISLALLQFVLRRNGVDPALVRWRTGTVSYAKNAPPPASAAVFVDGILAIPPPAPPPASQQPK